MSEVKKKITPDQVADAFRAAVFELSQDERAELVAFLRDRGLVGSLVTVDEIADAWRRSIDGAAAAWARGVELLADAAAARRERDGK